MSQERRRSRGRAVRLRRGEGIAAISGLLLFVFMFLTWYGSEVSGQAGEIRYEGAGAGGSAWQTLEWIPLFLLLAIVVAIGAAALRAVGSGWKPAIAPGAAVAALGGLATLLIGFRILVPPSFGTLGGVEVDATLSLGVFLGLAAALGIAYGGYRAMGEEGSSFAKVADSLNPDPRHREGRRREGKDAGRPSKRAH